MKKNPLFVDSTKFRGDSILTQFELKDFDKPGPLDLQVRVDRESGEEQWITLVPVKNRSWIGRIYLEHQEKIRFQFCLLKNEKVLAQSENRKSEASYLIESFWELGSFSWQEELVEGPGAEKMKPVKEAPSAIAVGPQGSNALLEASKALSFLSEEPQAAKAVLPLAVQKMESIAVKENEEVDVAEPESEIKSVDKIETLASSTSKEKNVAADIKAQQNENSEVIKLELPAVTEKGTSSFEIIEEEFEKT